MHDTYSLTPYEASCIDRMNPDELRTEMIRTGKELEYRAGGVYQQPETSEKLTDMYDYASDALGRS